MDILFAPNPASWTSAPHLTLLSLIAFCFCLSQWPTQIPGCSKHKMRPNPTPPCFPFPTPILISRVYKHFGFVFILPLGFGDPFIALTKLPRIDHKSIDPAATPKLHLARGCSSSRMFNVNRGLKIHARSRRLDDELVASRVPDVPDAGICLSEFGERHMIK